MELKRGKAGQLRQFIEGVLVVEVMLDVHQNRLNAFAILLDG